MYREAKNQNVQIQILADLSTTDRVEIIKILVRNGEKFPSRAINYTNG